MKMTDSQYREFAEQHAPRSDTRGNMLRAFLVGGLICAAGQGIKMLYVHLGAEEEAASVMLSVTLIFVGAFMTGLGIYDDIAAFAGAGTLVPITGFANSVVSPALEFKTEGFITGTAAKMFIIAGPVIVYGISASTVYGLILCLIN